jgi:hypothetical protein
MEYVSGGEILKFDKLEERFYNPRKSGYFDEIYLRKLFRQLLAGLDYRMSYKRSLIISTSQWNHSQRYQTREYPSRRRRKRKTLRFWSSNTRF